MGDEVASAEEAFEIGVSDGQAWFQQKDSGALVGDHENMIPDDYYPAYVRGVGEGIRLLAHRMYHERGWEPWTASESCWE
jgi:hypothetical protein